MTGGRTLVVMAKAPGEGGAKTRLAASAGLGAAEITALVEAFLLDGLDHARTLPSVAVRVCFAPASQRAWFEARVAGLELVAQVEGDLGTRLVAAYDEAFRRGADRVVIVGSDAPHLPSSRIVRAFDELEGHDVVLGPALDGGYYLVGLRGPAAALFEDIPWSTDRVLDATVARAGSLGLTVAQLEPTYDVDGALDLERLAADITLGSVDCPRTARVLRSLRRI